MGVGHYLFSFSGRINRAKMWLFFLLIILFWIAVIALIVATLGVQHILDVAQQKAPPSVLMANPMLPAVFGAIGLADLALIWISLAVTTKRLHDRDKSAWWLLVFIVLPTALNIVRLVIVFGSMHAGGSPVAMMNNPVGTLLGGAALIIQLWAFVELYCLRGTVGDNRFGPDPLAERG